MLNKKKILTVCKGHNNIAGAQLYLQHVAEVFDQNKYELHYAYHFKDGDRVFNEIASKRPVVTWEYDWRHLCFKRSFRAALRLINKIKPEIILYNSSEDEIIPPVIAGYLSRIPCQAMTVHYAQEPDSLQLIVKKQSIPFPIVSRYALLTRLKRSFAYALLDKIIFVNKVTRMAYKNLYRVNPSKCTTIYNGIELNRFFLPDDTRQKIRTQLSVRDEQIMLLASGNLTRVKGHQFLIDAVELLLSNGKPVKCFVAGQGELNSYLSEYIERKKLDKNILLLGYRNDIPQLLKATDIFCMPSLNEALGYSMLEAMAVGIPVVASKVGGIPEVVTDSIDGLLVPPSNSEALSCAINRLIEDNYLRDKMGQNGKQNVMRNFSINKMIRSTIQFLKP